MNDHILWHGQPGDLGVLRGVAGGVTEDARTRGFAPLSLDRFAFTDEVLMGA